MAKKAASEIPAAKVALYDKLVATNPKVDRKGAKMPYTSVNGNMFSFLTEDGTMALRLSEADRDAFIKKHKTKLCERHGTVMKEYVVVPDKLLKKTAELKKCLDKSVTYASGLNAKATTKKKESAKKKAVKKKAAKKRSTQKETAKRKTKRS